MQKISAKQFKKIHGFIDSDDGENFYQFLNEFTKGQVNLTNIRPFMNYVFSCSAINCFKKLIEMNFDFQNEYKNYLGFLANAYKYSPYTTEKRNATNLVMTEFIIQHFNIDLNALPATTKPDCNMPYIILVADEPVLFSLYLKYGSNPDVLFNLEVLKIPKIGLIGLEEAITLMHETLRGNNYLGSIEALKKFKAIIKEKEELNKNLPIKDKVNSNKLGSGTKLKAKI